MISHFSLIFWFLISLVVQSGCKTIPDNSAASRVKAGESSLWYDGDYQPSDEDIAEGNRKLQDVLSSESYNEYLQAVKDQSAQGTYDQAQQSRTSDSEFSLSGEPSVAGKCNNRNATTAAGASCHPLVPTSFDPSKYRAESLSQNVYEACEWYSNIRNCMRDCDAACRERLQGYERVCRAASSMMQPNGGSIGVIAGINCAMSRPYQEFGMNMRRCLQDRVAMTVNGGSCPSCTTLINGMPGDIETGIIGAHTPCVRNTRMCQLSQADKKCFGAAFGYGFGAVNPFAGAPTGAGLGGELQGPFKAVGICHLFSQFAECGAKSGRYRISDALDHAADVCEGFVNGCRQSPANTATTIGELTGVKGCLLTCPAPALRMAAAAFRAGGKVSSGLRNSIPDFIKKRIFPSKNNAAARGGGMTSEVVISTFENECRTVLGEALGRH